MPVAVKMAIERSLVGFANWRPLFAGQINVLCQYEVQIPMVIDMRQLLGSGNMIIGFTAYFAGGDIAPVGFRHRAAVYDTFMGDRYVVYKDIVVVSRHAMKSYAYIRLSGIGLQTDCLFSPALCF